MQLGSVALCGRMPSEPRTRPRSSLARLVGAGATIVVTSATAVLDRGRPCFMRLLRRLSSISSFMPPTIAVAIVGVNGRSCGSTLRACANKLRVQLAEALEHFAAQRDARGAGREDPEEEGARQLGPRVEDLEVRAHGRRRSALRMAAPGRPRVAIASIVCSASSR